MSIIASLAKLIKGAQRVKANRAARYKTNGFATPFGEVRDLSASGMRVASPRKPKLEANQKVEMRLSSAFQQVVVCARVAWVRNTDSGWQVGFQFVNLAPGVREAVECLAKHGFAEMGVGPGPRRGGHANVNSHQKQQEQAGGKSILEQTLLYEDLYAMFGVAPDSPIEVIQASYRKLAHQVHPDHNSAPDAAEQFGRLTKAFSILKDEEKRRRYDEMRRRPAA